MAKKTIDQAIDEIFKNCRIAITRAVNEASNKATEDIYDYSLSCLDDYYDAYAPSSYDRTYNLDEAFFPHLSISEAGNTIVSTVGIDYDATVLDGVYSGSKKYTPVDGMWVLTNYLRGIHPATDGSSIPGNAVYYEIIDDKSPEQKMDEYFMQYNKIFASNLLVSFMKQALEVM